jgi:hypothetical protein
MTVSSQTSRVEYAGDGATVTFVVPFYFLGAADLVVYLGQAQQTLTTHYTVTGAGDQSGGSITFLTPPGGGATVTILREPPITQLLDYTPNGRFPAESHERGLDKLVMIAQRLNDKVDRAIKLSDFDIDGQSVFDAHGNRFSNVGAPIGQQDAATKAYVDAVEFASESSQAFMNRFQGVYGYTPEMFGADGTAAGDTAALVALAALGAVRVIFQPRDYWLAPGGYQGVSGQQWIGVKGKTKIRCSAQMTGPGADVMFWNGKSDMLFEGVIFDGNGYTAGSVIHNTPPYTGGRFLPVANTSRYPGSLPVMHLSECSNVLIKDCEFVGYDTHGILINLGTSITLENVKTNRATQERLYPNYGVGVVGDKLTLNNVQCYNGGIAGYTTNSFFGFCRVEGWAMGAAYNQASVGTGLAGDNVYVGCEALDSNRAQDLDDYSPGGFEIFSPRSTFIGCKTIRAFGAGVYLMAPDCTLIGCDFFDNGDPTFGGIGVYLLREAGTGRGADRTTIVGVRGIETGTGANIGCTITASNPAVITSVGHGMKDGSRGFFGTNGTLPAGITGGATYFVHNATANTFNIATKAKTSTLVATTNVGSGNHNFTSLRTQQYGYLEQAGAALVGVKLDQTCRFTGNVNAQRQYDGTGTEDPNSPMFSYVPTVTAESGGYSVAPTAVGQFQKVGTRGIFRVTITVGAAAVGSAAAAVVFTLPWNVVAETAVTGYERNLGLGGLYGRAVQGSNLVNVKTVSNGFPGGNNAILTVAGEVEIAA